MAYIDYLAKCQKHLCASDTQSIQAWYDQETFSIFEAGIFSSSSPILYNSSLKEKFLRVFYFFSVYPGPLARAYKIIKEGLIKGKLYTEPEFFSSVQLAPPTISVHDSVHCASSNKKVLSKKENFLSSTVQLPNPSWNIQYGKCSLELFHRKLSWK